jgi:hypothetical protein
LNELNKEIEDIKINKKEKSNKDNNTEKKSNSSDEEEEYITVKEHDEEERKLKPNIHWTKNKNMESLNSKKQPNVLFYSNETECVPYGDLIENILNKWYGNYDILENHHGYIQWLFPNTEDRGTNQYAVPLSHEEAEIISKDEKLKHRAIAAVKLFSDFIGLDYDENKNTFQRSKNYQTRYKGTFNKPKIEMMVTPHNYLRITRMLKFLRDIKLNSIQEEFISFMTKEILENDQLVNAFSSLIDYWM